MERKTHTKTNHLVLPSPDGAQPALLVTEARGGRGPSLAGVMGG